MPNLEILSSERHADLTVNTDFGSEFDDVSSIVSVVADELPQLVLDFPVFIKKNTNTGEFELSAMMGFSPKENLFINEGKWRAVYIPLDIRRQPFQACVIEGGDGQESLEQKGEVKVGINVESDRLMSGDGEVLFNSDGSASTYLDGISNTLGALMRGADLTKKFLKSLAELELIEPVKLNVQLGKQKVSFEGLYTIHAENLAGLPEQSVFEFHRKGYLQASYALIHSIGHMEKLVDWKAQRTA